MAPSSSSPAALTVPVGTLPPAVLLGGEGIAVTVARGLAKAGVRVLALGHRGVDPVRYSRYCSSFEHVGSGEGVQDRYFERLARPGGKRRVVLPCNDDALEMVARRRDELVERGSVPIEAVDELLLAMLDKERTYELARENGVATPLTRSVRSWDEVRAASDQLGFPLALKPRHSHLFARHFGMDTKLLFADDRDALQRAFERVAPLQLEMIATEIVPGPLGQITTFTAYLDEQSRPLVSFTRRKVRQYPPHFGRGCYYLMERDPAVAELGLRFLQSIGFRGLASVEFKRDSRDGRLKLLECNCRLDGAVGLAQAAGLDLGRLAYDRALGRQPRVPEFRRDGVRVLSPLKDCRSAFTLWREGRLGSLEWAASIAHRQHFKLFDVRDPLPSMVNGARIVRRHVGRPLDSGGMDSSVRTAPRMRTS